MIVRMQLLPRALRNTEIWQQIFNFLLHCLLWGVSFHALFVSFFLWKSFVIISKFSAVYSTPGKTDIMQNLVVLAKEFLTK